MSQSYNALTQVFLKNSLTAPHTHTILHVASSRRKRRHCLVFPGSFFSPQEENRANPHTLPYATSKTAYTHFCRKTPPKKRKLFPWRKANTPKRGAKSHESFRRTQLSLVLQVTLPYSKSHHIEGLQQKDAYLLSVVLCYTWFNKLSLWTFYKWDVSIL